MKLDENIVTLLDMWHVCPYSDEVDDLFECLRHCTEAYVTNGNLDTVTIISIVKDIRTYINPHSNVNIFYFTDIICDAILLKFEGLGIEGFPDFVRYTQECEMHKFVDETTQHIIQILYNKLGELYG